MVGLGGPCVASAVDPDGPTLDAEDPWARNVRDTMAFYTNGGHWHWRKQLDLMRDQGLLYADKIVAPWIARRQAEVWTAWLERCADSICSCDSPAIGSARAAALGRLEEPCDCSPLPRSIGQIGRTLRLGRTLWCAVAASRVDTAADLYTSTGGSAILLAHGLASSPGRSRRAVLWAWELQADHAWVAAKNLKVIKVDVALVKPPAWHGERAQAVITSASLASSSRANASVRAVIVSGAPPFTLEAGEQRGELIRALCDEQGHDAEFVFIDALGPFVPEFVALVQSCRRLRWVAVNNINLDEMAGWIARYLQNVTGWHVLAKGAYKWPADVTLSRGLVPRMRHWQLVARGDALLQSPPALSSWLQAVAASSFPVPARRTLSAPALGDVGAESTDLLEASALIFSGFIHPCRYLEVNGGVLGINHFAHYPGAEPTVEMMREVERFCVLGRDTPQLPWWHDELERRRLTYRLGVSDCSNGLRNSGWRNGPIAAEFAEEFFVLAKYLQLAGVEMIGVFVNLGAADGVRSDPLWSYSKQAKAGVAVEMDPESCAAYRRNFPSATLLCERLTLDTLSRVAEAVPIGMGGYDVLKVDVDGYDCEMIWALLTRFDHRPIAIMLEINPAFPPPFEFAMEHDPAWDEAHAAPGLGYGCSLSHAVRMLSRRLPEPRYVLLYVAKNHAVFLREDVARKLLGTEDAPDDFLCYQLNLLEARGVGPAQLRRWFFSSDLEEAAAQMRTMVRADLTAVFGERGALAPFRLVVPGPANAEPPGLVSLQERSPYAFVFDAGSYFLGFKDLLGGLEEPVAWASAVHRELSLKTS